MRELCSRETDRDGRLFRRLYTKKDLRLSALDAVPGGSTLGLGGGGQAPKIVARPPNLAALLTHYGQFIFRKKRVDATRCQILS